MKMWHLLLAAPVAALLLLAGVAIGAGHPATAVPVPTIAPAAVVAPTAMPTAAVSVGATETAAHAYPAAFEANFLKGFDNLPPAVASCMLRETERRYTYDEFRALARRYGGTGTLPPEVQQINLYCVARYS